MAILDLDGLADLASKVKPQLLETADGEDIHIIIHEGSDHDFRLSANQIVVNADGEYLIREDLEPQDGVIHAAFSDEAVEDDAAFFGMAKALAVLADVLDIELDEEHVDLPPVRVYEDILLNANWYLDNGFEEE